MLWVVVRNKLAFTLFVHDRLKIICEFMRNPLIPWSLYLIPIFSESEDIEHWANSSHKSVFIGARGMSESDIARHVAMGRTYRLRAAPSGHWQKYFRLSNWVSKSKERHNVSKSSSNINSVVLQFQVHAFLAPTGALGERIFFCLSLPSGCWSPPSGVLITAFRVLITTFCTL